MNFKKFGVSVLVLSTIYVLISYVFSKFFGREFILMERIFYALGFSIAIMCIHFLLEKLKNKSK